MLQPRWGTSLLLPNKTEQTPIQPINSTLSIESRGTLVRVHRGIHKNAPSNIIQDSPELNITQMPHK